LLSLLLFDALAIQRSTSRKRKSKNPPPRAQAVRDEVMKIKPGSGNIITKLEEFYFDLLSIDDKLQVPVETRQDLVKPLAEDNLKLGLNSNMASALSDAQEQIDINGSTAFTASNDTFYVIKGGEAFDKLHEYVHILSGPGGRSIMKDFSNKFNEGAINYFSELLAESINRVTPGKIQIIPRYPEETNVAKVIANYIGIDFLFIACFQGDYNQLFNAIGDKFFKEGCSGYELTRTEKDYACCAPYVQDFRQHVKHWKTKEILWRLAPKQYPKPKSSKCFKNPPQPNPPAAISSPRASILNSSGGKLRSSAGSKLTTSKGGKTKTVIMK